MLRPNAQVASTVPLRSSETAEGYNEGMAEERSTSSQPTDALEVLSEEDRVWLAETHRRIRGTARISPQQLRLPTLSVIVAINASVRRADEWFEEPDELHRIEILLEQLSSGTDAVNTAALCVSRIVRAQAFSEGNKRTALLVGAGFLTEMNLMAVTTFPMTIWH